jgi:hypothetical protein
MTNSDLAFAALLTGTVLLSPGLAQRMATAAVVAAGLGLAGLRAASTPLPAAFLAVDGALMIVTVVLAFTSAVRAWRRREATVLAPVCIVAGAIGLVVGSGWVVAASRPLALLGAAGSVAAVGLALYGLGRVIRFRERDPVAGRPSRHPAATAGWVAGVAAAGLGPHLGLVIIGVIVATWSAWLVRRSNGGPRVPVSPVLTFPLLGGWWLMATIAGPEGLSIGALPLLPASPAAERLLAPVFLLAGWATAGLWPLHRQVDGALLAPVGAILLARVAIPILPDGVEHWRPLAMPLIVAGVWHAALSGRHGELAVGLAWIGLLGLTAGGQLGAALLLAGALATELGRKWPASRVAQLGLSAANVAAGIGGVLAVEAGLRGEVVYTVLAVAALLAAVGHASREAMIPSARSITEPSC